MRAFGISLSLTLVTVAAVAQQPSAQSIKTFASSADVAALREKAKSERKERSADGLETYPATRAVQCESRVPRGSRPRIGA